MSELHLTLTLEPRGPAGALLLDDDQVARLGGGRKAFPVRVTVGARSAQLRLTRMRGENLIGMAREVRSQLAVELGEELDVVIAVDDAPREVALPEDLAAALDANPASRAAFDALAPSRRKEHARSVADAKRPETRARRIEKVLEAVRA